MNRFIPFFLLMTGTITFSVYGQKTVTGRLIDKETGKPVKDALVTQVGTEITTTSNALGYFQLQIDSTASIEITNEAYPVTKIELPEGNNFRIELTRKPEAKVYKIFEQGPEFPGGMKELFNFVKRHTRQPSDVRRGSISGTVWVDFVIDSTGLIPPGDVKINKGLSVLCDKEAMRVITQMPRWNPGIQMDKPVRVKMTIPVKFAQE